jgi:hypothetical protein
MEDEETRNRAKQWAKEAPHFDEPIASMINGAIDTMPLTLVGMSFCKVCESVLCGVCGDCHSWDLRVSDPPCLNDHDTIGQNCVAWWQALESIMTVQMEYECRAMTNKRPHGSHHLLSTFDGFVQFSSTKSNDLYLFAHILGRTHKN